MYLSAALVYGLHQRKKSEKDRTKLEIESRTKGIQVVLHKVLFVMSWGKKACIHHSNNTNTPTVAGKLDAHSHVHLNQPVAMINETAHIYT